MITERVRVAGFEDEEREPRAKESRGGGGGSGWKSENSRKQIIPYKLRKEHSLANTLILLQ